MVSAYEEIRDAIVEGRYEPGTRLVEQRIAAELNVSRTPVREALRTLDAEGMVRLERNRGATVRGFDVAEVVDLYELRARLEAYAAELAAQRHDDTDLATIDEGIAAFGAAVAAPGRDAVRRARALNEANATVHRGIVTAARHEQLEQLLARTVDATLVFRSFRSFRTDQVRRSHEFHQLIRDAIAAREPARAGSLMAEHVLQGRDVLLEDLRAREAGAQAGQSPARES